MELVYTDEFRKQYKKLSDEKLRVRIQTKIKKLLTEPNAGKPLRGNLKHFRTLRIKPFRVIYHVKGDDIIMDHIGHRKKVYNHHK